MKINSEADIVRLVEMDEWMVEIKPTSFFRETQARMQIYEARIVQKNWKARWPKVKVTHAQLKET